MKRITILAFFLTTLTPISALFSQSQDEVAQQIQSYVAQMQGFVEPAKAAFEELNQHYANRRTGSMEAGEAKVESIAREAYAKLDAVKPLYGEDQLIEATAEILRVLINGTQDEFPKITNRYKVANPSQSDQDAIVEYINRFNAKWRAAGTQFERATESLYLKFWAPLGNKDLCPAIDAILRDIPNRFENLKGKEDEMVPSTWDCKNAFPGAKNCRCMFLRAPAVKINFMESSDFQQIESAQHALYLYVKACAGDNFKFSESRLKSQEKIDAEETSAYTFGQSSNWEGQISVDKSYGKYRLMLSFEITQ